MFKKVASVCTLLALVGCQSVEQPANQDINSLANTLSDRWQQEGDGISWEVNNDIHQDHLEFSGEQVSAIIYYGTDPLGNLALLRKVVWPMLRTIPNDTHASLIHDFPLSISPQIFVNGQPKTLQKLKRVEFDGVLNFNTILAEGISLTRTLAPSRTKPVIVEKFTLKNDSKTAVDLTIEPVQYRYITPKEDGVYGAYEIEAVSDKSGEFTLQPDQSLTLYVQFRATKKGQNKEIDLSEELEARRSYVASLSRNLRLETPEPVINQMFDFAKLRAAESIFRTSGGLMHGPGGSRYYAAIWANDQAEYVNPFFPFLGDTNGNESAINSFNTFAQWMNPTFEAIPSSIIAEGTDYWNGAGDRGDCAMIAYGASRFALAYGDKAQAKLHLPLIDWCLTFGERKMTPEGVIASDSDELEGRFPAGDVNLSTNTLAYGGYVSASYLHSELGNTDKAEEYDRKARQLAEAIERYFGANVQGYNTYRYYEGNDKLRAWIALPLTMGMFQRKAETLEALLSDHLWSENGIYTEAGDKTFWDRATLYAFRGIFAAGETDTAMRYFKYYSRKRLLGDHVPYAVEAWPEGNQRHLSAESGLYARVITEGLFGIEPVGLRAFYTAPKLPTQWNNMCIRDIQAFQSNVDICVQREGKSTRVTVMNNNLQVLTTLWDQKSPILVKL